LIGGAQRVRAGAIKGHIGGARSRQVVRDPWAKRKVSYALDLIEPNQDPRSQGG